MYVWHTPVGGSVSYTAKVTQGSFVQAQSSATFRTPPTAVMGTAVNYVLGRVPSGPNSVQVTWRAGTGVAHAFNAVVTVPNCATPHQPLGLFAAPVVGATSGRNGYTEADRVGDACNFAGPTPPGTGIGVTCFAYLGSTPSTSPVVGLAPLALTPGLGALAVQADGAVGPTVGASYYADALPSLNAPVVGGAGTTQSRIWEVAADGGVFARRAAHFAGSMGGRPLNAPMVGMALVPFTTYRTLTMVGYWLVAADGGIFSFGNARFFGSMGGRYLNAPIVGMAPTPDGKGYWEVASDGGVFSFGDAQFFGSMGGHPLNSPIVAIVSTTDGLGYRLIAADGGVFCFGQAQFYGSAA